MGRCAVPGLACLPSDTFVVSAGRSHRLPGTRPEAVLLIHGFTGCTDDMLYLGRRLEQVGFTVSIPRLPGHGTNHADFLASHWRDWLRAAVDGYLELKREFREVYIAGLSMGGVLALILAAEFRPGRIALAAPAIKVNVPGLAFTPLLGLFVKRLRRPEYVEEEVDPDRIYLSSEYWRWQWVAPAADLLRLQRIARRMLAMVEAPTLTIVSKGDSTVSWRVAEYLESRIGAKERNHVVLERSGHVVVNGVEKVYVADQIVDWFVR